MPPPTLMALIFGVVGIFTAWSIRRDFTTGAVTDDEDRTYTRQDNPFGFGAVIAGKAAVICFAIAYILFALGVIGDPVEALGSVFTLFGGSEK